MGGEGRRKRGTWVKALMWSLCLYPARKAQGLVYLREQDPPAADSCLWVGGGCEFLEVCFEFRRPGPEPMALSPLLLSSFSSDKGSAQGQAKASLWREFQTPGPGRRFPVEERGSWRLLCAPLLPSLLPLFCLPALSPLFHRQLSYFLNPRSCALRWDPESKVCGSTRRRAGR